MLSTLLVLSKVALPVPSLLPMATLVKPSGNSLLVNAYIALKLGTA